MLTILKETQKYQYSPPDTDVEIYPFITKSIEFITDKKNVQRKINLSKIYNGIRELRPKSLLVFHALTGADTAGQFTSRIKKSCFKTFLRFY